MARTRRRGTTGAAIAKRFGWNQTDTTTAIQGAIDSAAHAVEVPYISGFDGEWLVTPLTMRSDQGIFGRGVLRQKGTGEDDGFGVITANLLACSLKENVSVGGGLTLKMRREDLSVSDLGPHCLNVRGSSNIEVDGVKLFYGSGDGMYLGPDVTGDRTGCEDAIIRDCYFDGNRRQGMSIVNANRVLVERCVFTRNGKTIDGVDGAQPKAGMDIEPEDDTDTVNNITVRHCTFSDNGLSGAIVNVNELEFNSQPCNILFDQCVFEGAAFGLRLKSLAAASVGPLGTIEIRDCVIRNTGWQGIWIDDWDPGRAHKLKLTRCKLLNVAQTQAGTVPIYLEITDECVPQSTGGIVFDDCVIIDNMNRNPIEVVHTSGDQADDSTLRVTGTIRVINPRIAAGAFSSGMANLTVTVSAS